jgi:subfamily B ATP-binding cassette protein MsbA
MAGGAATTAALALHLDPAIKLVFLEKRTDMALLIPVAIIAVVFVRAGLNFGETVLANRVGQRIVADAQRAMVRSLAGFDLGRLNLVHSGQFISKFIYDATLLREAITKGFRHAKEFLSLFLGSVMIYQDWLISARRHRSFRHCVGDPQLGRTMKASSRGMVETGELSTALSEMLDGRIVKAYGLEAQAIARAEARIDNRLVM